MVERTNLEDTLDERKSLHGPFQQHAIIEQKLRYVCATYGTRLTPVQSVAIGMIMHKIARIINGGHQQSDTWHDIAGYATLAEKEILDE
jgi:hypothetical protein